MSTKAATSEGRRTKGGAWLLPGATYRWVLVGAGMRVAIIVFAVVAAAILVGGVLVVRRRRR